MEVAARERRRSRVEARYRHSPQDVTPRALPEQKIEEEEEVAGDTDESLLARERKGRTIMGRAHRMFHRRAEPSQVLTVIVDVVATVDSAGKTIGLATSTPVLVNAQAVPTVALPSVPQVLPSVPQVPPFPSDLTVPAYPFPSGVPTAIPTVVPAPTTAIPSPSPVPSQPSGTGSVALSALPTSSVDLNLTSSSVVLSSSVRPTLNSSSLTLTTGSSSTQTLLSALSSSQSTSFSGALPTFPGPGGIGPVTTAVGPAATGAAAGPDGNSNRDPPLATPKVVGSVIGSLAGAALFLVFILFLIRRHKRRLAATGAQRLAMDDAADSQPMASSGQQMATRGSYIPASASAFLNRFSGVSRSTADTSTTAGGGERGFQRISGRKLPSAFSEGMTSDQFARDGTLSESSFYQDDKGFYGGPGTGGKEFGESSAIGAASAGEKVVPMPSPARTPTVYHPPPPFGHSRNGGSLLSPPHSPNPSLPPRGSLGRSHPSQDGSRNSRFTEDV